MSEIERIQLSEIPEHWEFPEKNNPGLKIEQLDTGNNFVAVSWPTILGEDEEGNLIIYSSKDDSLFADPSEYADYILRPDGTPLSFRHHSFNNTLVVLSRGDMRLAYKIKDWHADRRYEFWDFQILGSFIEDVRDVGSLRIANFIYKSDNLHEVSLETAFIRVSDSEDGLVKAPIIILATDPYQPSFGEDTNDWRLVRKNILENFLRKKEIVQIR